ncbi:hypothetical protein [Micromonospora zhanjiangensis]|uniref:Uncharacterized protein n=1 Tax=Micromonospora zhanjiangensis TaxID=1522057 RepID=A0ABV8KNI4_9ACTN
MSVRPEITDLLRALARSDWGTVDRLTGESKVMELPNALQVIGMAFALAVGNRFGAAPDLNAITRFVSDTRARYVDGKDLPALETEALIRAAVGEPELLDTLSPEVYIPAQIVVLGTLLRDDMHSEEQLETFINEVEQAAAQYL